MKRETHKPQPAKTLNCAMCGASVAASWGWIFVGDQALDLCGKHARAIRYADADERLELVREIIERNALRMMFRRRAA